MFTAPGRTLPEGFSWVFKQSWLLLLLLSHGSAPEVSVEKAAKDSVDFNVGVLYLVSLTMTYVPDVSFY